MMEDEFGDDEQLANDAPVRVYRWEDLDGAQAAELWAELIAWVGWFRRRYAVSGSDAVIPPCWFRHPVAVEEPTGLMVSHQSAYTLDEPGSELSAFHVQWLWPTLRDLAERAGYKRCTDAKCSFKALEIVGRIRMGRSGTGGPGSADVEERPRRRPLRARGPAAPTVQYGYYPGVGDQIREAAERQFRKLAADDLLRGRDRVQFVAGLADHWGEINTIHSFREGNTRTQSVFVSQLAREAGYELDVGQFAENAPLRTEFVQARFYNQATARTDRLEGVVDKALTEIEPPSRSLTDRPLSAMERLARRRSRTHSEGEFEI